MWLGKFLNLILASCVGLILISAVQLGINRETFDKIAAQEDVIIPEIPFSQNGPNSVLLLLDRAMGELIPEAQEAFPELQQEYDGFTWYEILFPTEAVPS